mgnify:CR=1 FL=1
MKDENGYPRSVINRFTSRVGAETLQLIIEEKVIWLLRRSRAVDVDVLLDAIFIKARSIRHPDDSRAGFSDSDSMVGRNGRFYGLGFKLHVAVDHRSVLPIATILAPANDNEKSGLFPYYVSRNIQQWEAWCIKVLPESSKMGSLKLV